MDTLTFISKVLEAIAWPGTVLIVACLFRARILELFPRISQLKYKEVEVLFDTITKQRDQVVEQTLEIKHKLETGEADGPSRVQLAAQFESSIKEASRLDQQRKLLTSQLLTGRLSPGRESILRILINQVMGRQKVLSLAEVELIAQFSGIARDIRNNQYFGAHGLNAGALTGLCSVGIIDESDQLTNLGAALMKNLAEEMDSSPA
jgi:hypothetical protein